MWQAEWKRVYAEWRKTTLRESHIMKASGQKTCLVLLFRANCQHPAKGKHAEQFEVLLKTKEPIYLSTLHEGLGYKAMPMLPKRAFSFFGDLFSLPMKE